MRVRGVKITRRNLAYLVSRRFRKPCDGCGRRWYRKGMAQQCFGPMGRSPKRHYCDGRCAR